MPDPHTKEAADHGAHAESTESSARPEDVFHIVSCHGSGNAVRKYVERSPDVEGLDHICGTHPWLFIYRYSTGSLSPSSALDGTRLPLDPISSVPLLRNLRYGFSALGSLVEEHASVPPFAKGYPAGAERIDNHIFVRPLPVDYSGLEPRIDFLARVKECVAAVDGRVHRILALHHSEWWFCIEASLPVFSKLGELVSGCFAKGIEMSTRCVLVRWKHRGDAAHYRRLHKKRRQVFDREPAPHPELKCANAVRNDPTFFEHSLDEQLGALERALGRAIEPTNEDAVPIEDQLGFEPTGRYVRRDQLAHPNRYVRRVSLRPTSPTWVLHFVLLRLPPQGFEEQRAEMAKLAGIRSNLVVPRVYRIAGQHGTFMISAYTLGDTGKNDLAQLTAKLNPLELPTFITCKLRQGEPIKLAVLSPTDVATVKGLHRNGACADAFFDEVREITTGQAQSLQFSPRALPVLLRHVTKKSSHADAADVARWRSRRAAALIDSNRKLVDRLGLGLTWELGGDAIQIALVRLYPKSDANVGEVAKQNAEALEGILETNAIALDYFLTERNEVVGIARFEKLAQLERFLWRVRKRFSRTEFHLVMDEAASIPGLEASEICAPCPYPTAVSRSAEPVSAGSSELGRPAHLVMEREPVDCGRCGRYLRKSPAQGLKVRVDMRPASVPGSDEAPPHSMQNVVFGALDLSLSFQELIALGVGPAWLLEKLKGHHSDRTMTLADFSLDADWRKGDASQSYDAAIADLVTTGALADAQVAVLPEYCVPRRTLLVVLDRLAQQPGDRERFLVLGSHLDDRGYNTAPIVHIRDGKLRLYWQQKLRRSPTEEKLGHVPSVGNASYVFRTSFGNLLVAICADIYSIEDKLRLADIDALLIPSFHAGPEGLAFGDAIAKNIDTKHLVRVFANGARLASDTRVVDGELVSTKVRVPSEIHDCAFHERSPHRCESTSSVTLGQYSGKVLLRTVDVIANDVARALEQGGRPADGVIPVHPDLWSKADQANLRDRESSLLRAILHDDEGKRRSGKLSDHLTLDWRAAEALFEKT